MGPHTHNQKKAVSPQAKKMRSKRAERQDQKMYSFFVWIVRSSALI